MILSLIAFVVGVFGLIILTTTPLVSSYTDSDNWYRIIFNGNVKWRIVGFTTIYSASGFPIAFTYLSLIGISAIVIGSIYWLFLTFTGNKNCALTDFSLPGPITGILFSLGGIIGFIGSMIFIPYGNDVTTGGIRYAIGYYAATIVLGLFILIGALILLTLKKGKKKRKR
jgi:hypothetical protein